MLVLLFGQTGRPAERFINADPDAWYTVTAEHMGPEPTGITCARSTTPPRCTPRIGVPLLFLWAARDDLEDLCGDPLAIWRDRAGDVHGRSLDCGHHIAGEAPTEPAAC